MNPTEKLIHDLIVVLAGYEKTTGVYITKIDIERVPVKDCGTLRAQSAICNIKLRME